MMFNLVGSFSFYFFQNMSLVALLLILLPQWYLGLYIDPAVAFFLLAMFFFLYY